MKRRVEAARERSQKKHFWVYAIAAFFVASTFLGTIYGGPCSRPAEDPERAACIEEDLGNCDVDATCTPSNNNLLLSWTSALQSPLGMPWGYVIGLGVPLGAWYWENRKDAKRYHARNIATASWRKSFSGIDGGRIPVPGGKWEIFRLGGTDDGVSPDEGAACVFTALQRDIGVDIEGNATTPQVPLHRWPPEAYDIAVAEDIKGPYYMSLDPVQHKTDDPKMAERILSALDNNSLVNRTRTFHEKVMQYGDDRRDWEEANLELVVSKVAKVVPPQNGGQR